MTALKVFFLGLVVILLTAMTSDTQDAWMREAVLVTLEEQPAAWVEQKYELETPGERRERLKVLRDAILSETGSFAYIAALIELSWQETRLSKYAYEDCTPYDKRYTGHCDRIMWGPRKGEIRARSNWQLWSRTCPKLWELPSGSKEATEAAAGCALRIWKHGLQLCKGDIVGAFSRFRGGAVGCNWGPAQKRAQRYQETRRELERNYQRIRAAAVAN